MMERLLEVSRKPDGDPEIFYSIQGEGVNIGRPAIFLRLSRCNLRCVWCDTQYTWNWKIYSYKEQSQKMSVNEVEQEILRHNCKYLVVTGGEPLLQQKYLAPLLQSLRSKDFFIEIETNGTILPDRELVSITSHWSVSPKLENSNNPKSLREVPECYNVFSSISSCHFKYVIRNEDDFKEIQSIMKKYDIGPEKVILMPQAQNREDLEERSAWLVEFCKIQGCLFSTRLHILLWGDKRGV